MTDKPVPPKIDNAPGLIWRYRKSGWYAFWRCRGDIRERGYKPSTVPLWRGWEPNERERAMISDQCNIMQNGMLVFARGLPQFGTVYDGTIRGLIRCYREDRDSDYQRLRYETRSYYDRLCRRIETDHGADRIADLGGRDMRHWHDAWSPSGIPMAHSLMRMTRALFGYGLTLLEDAECTRMCTVLSKQRFQMGKSRTERLTAEQAIAIRKRAHEKGYPSIALAQAIQFECMLRQKDVIGEWVPGSEPGISDITHDGEKWLQGIRWSEIDGNLIIRHVTSKRQKPVEHDLRLADMVKEELTLIYGGIDRALLPAGGPIVMYERTKRPYIAHQFRREWRMIATDVGVPKSVRNMDTRAGAITEATEAGAELEHIKHAAAHSDISMTQKYARAGAEKAANVARLRAEHRKNKSGT